jgi:hypothetical protein
MAKVFDHGSNIAHETYTTMRYFAVNESPIHQQFINDLEQVSQIEMLQV